MTPPDNFASSFGPSSLTPPPDLANDAPFAESYDLVRELGRGGMAIVYLMRERATGIERAVKVIHTKFVDDEEALARFDREARLVAQLKHPNIVATHSVRWIEAVGFGLVMDHVPGRTLKQILRDGAPISFEQATQILDDIAAALSYAHVQGIVHRDVKPENIFIDETTGRALLADFGIARSVQSETQLTMAGVAIGTPTYMAPEQIDGSMVDARSDLYSLGLVGWEMLTGRRPWDGETLYNVIYHQKHDRLAAIDALRPDTPLNLVCAIEGMLEKSPAARWQSADEFRAQLASASPARRTRQYAEPAPDETIAITIPAAQRVRRRIRRVTPIAAVAAVLVSATLLFAWPAPIWGPISHDRSAPVKPKAKLAVTPAPTFLHSPVPNYGAMNSAAAGISSAGGTAASPVAAPADSSEDPSQDSSADSAIAAPQSKQSRQPKAATPDTGIASRGSIATTAIHDAPVSITLPIPSVPPPPAAKISTAVPRILAPVASRAHFAVSTGGAHTCLISAVGTYCWGANNSGQLGTGVTMTTATPTAIAGSSHFASVAPGLSHTCALDDRGSAFCWGNNEHGQLGDGTHASTDAPSKVAIAHSLVSVVSGSGFSCGLTSDGRIYCWGANNTGQLGDGTSQERVTPVRVSTTVAFAKLAAGWNHVCGLTDTGHAYCWGANNTGQLGDGSITNHGVPAPVNAELRFTTLSAGSGHTCGVTTGGVVYCWGDNQYGQLGDGSRSMHLTPFAINSTQRFVSVSAGSVHTCAVTQEHDAWCWGRNTYGQLGDGTTDNRSIPVQVSGGHDFTSVDSFGSHTCGTTTADELFCWGYNLDGQLGDGTREHRLRPTYIEKPTG